MKYKLVNAKELEKLMPISLLKTAREEAYNNGYEDGKSEYEGQVEDLEETVDEKNARIKKLQRELTDKNTELEVLNKQKSDARDVVTKRLANENIAADLKAREELVAKKESKLTAREEAVAASEVSTKDGQYKEGYADGVADGVRKISEITQVDRQNAMDVAMVSAASHAQPETVKAVLDGSKAIKSSLANKEDK